MAVYTHVSAEALGDLPGALRRRRTGLRQGHRRGRREHATTSSTRRSGRFILTLYEKRVEAGDLPFFMALLDHLAAQGPAGAAGDQGPRRRRDPGAGGPPGLPDPLPARRVAVAPDPAQARAAGAALAAMHAALGDFAATRAELDGRRRAGGRCSSAAARDLDAIAPGLRDELGGALDAVLAALAATTCRSRAIHADLFPDNVLMLGDQVTGLIDFYFACTDIRAYDLAVMHTAWAFDATRRRATTAAVGAALLAGYRTAFGRSATPSARHLPMLAQRRLHPLPAVRAPGTGSTRPPTRWSRARTRSPICAGSTAYAAPSRGAVRMTELAMSRSPPTARARAIPGPGGWGAVMRFGRAREGTVGRRGADHQQPHGADRGDRGAERADAAVPRQAVDRQPLCDGRPDQVDPRLAARTAGGPPTRSRSRTPSCGRRCSPRPSRTAIDWVWVKGHAGHPDNERADQLASDAADAAGGG